MGIWSDIGDFGMGAIDFTLDLGEDIGVGIYDFTIDTGEKLIDPDTYVDLGNGIADGTIDTVDWMSDGSNWEAAGKTLGYSALSMITLKPGPTEKLLRKMRRQQEKPTQGTSQM